MFTGIIVCTGRLDGRYTHGCDQTLTITAPAFDFSRTQLGDSIAVNGVCLTVVDLGKTSFSADVSVETLNHTTLGGLGIGSLVNLEPALTLGTPLGGHLVSGHVDGLGKLTARQRDARSEQLTFQTSKEILRYIAHKGSITIDGVSLTVNQVDAHSFVVNIVPHTLVKTILADYCIGQLVNIEVDMIARYVERLLKTEDDTLSLQRLNELGY